MPGPAYDYNRRKRGSYQAERLRRRIAITFMLLVGGSIITYLTYLNLTR